MTDTFVRHTKDLFQNLCFYEHLSLKNIFVVLSRETWKTVVVVVVKCFMSLTAFQCALFLL